jgi:hypothetical protein
MTTDWRKAAEDAWSAPNWKEAAAQYQHARAGRPLIVEIEPDHLKLLRRLMSEKISLERAWAEISRAASERYNNAPEATWNAVQCELRTYGLQQLSNPSCQRRLADLSIAQIKNLMASLLQWREQYPNVSDALLAALAEIYDARIVANEQ